MTCKDCIHFDVCTKPYYGETLACNDVNERCVNFKNKSDYVEVKHGEWIYNVKYYSCSICAGKRFDLSLGTDADFCPYCGAKMDGRSDT